MSIKHRLMRLERGRPSQDRPVCAIAQYAGETESQARAAYPMADFPADVEILYLRRDGSRPAVCPPEDRPGYDARGLRAVLAEIDGETQQVKPSL